MRRNRVHRVFQNVGIANNQFITKKEEKEYNKFYNHNDEEDHIYLKMQKIEIKMKIIKII